MSGNRKQNNKTLRLVLMLALVVALAWFGARLAQNGDPAQSVPAQTAAPLTLLTDPPQTAAPVGSGEPGASADDPEELWPAESGSDYDDYDYGVDPPQTAEPVGSGEPGAAAQGPAVHLPAESGSYYDVEDVAYYLHTYGHLPDNYITKSEAEDAGWVSTKGNLWDVAYGSSIGGDRYWNSEGLLPKGERYYECDVNYEGGYRGSERIVYSEDGDIYYTTDHYDSFEKLY